MSSKKLRRARAAEELMLTRVMVVVQYPPEAKWVIDPAVERPVTRASASSTVKDNRPATEMVPERAAPGLGAAWKETLPLPFPEMAPVRVIQLALLAAAQGHPVLTVTLMVPVPPATSKACPAGLRE